MSKLNIVFDGPPGPECGRFVEVEDEDGRGVAYGEWIDADNGLWYLQFDDPRQVAGLRAEIAALNGKIITLDLDCAGYILDLDAARAEIAALREAVRIVERHLAVDVGESGYFMDQELLREKWLERPEVKRALEEKP